MSWFDSLGNAASNVTSAAGQAVVNTASEVKSGASSVGNYVESKVAPVGEELSAIGTTVLTPVKDAGLWAADKVGVDTPLATKRAYDNRPLTVTPLATPVSPVVPATPAPAAPAVNVDAANNAKAAWDKLSTVTPLAPTKTASELQADKLASDAENQKKLDAITKSATVEAKPLTIKSNDPNFGQTAGAILRKQQAEKLTTDLALQQQSQRMQFTQQLQDSGQKGSSLGTLAMLKDRELGSTMAGVQQTLSTNYLDYLDGMQKDSDTKTKASFAAMFNSYALNGDTDSAKAVAEAMSKEYPEDPYWSTMATPEGLELMKKGMAPAVTKLHDDTLKSVVANTVANVNIMDNASVKSQTPAALDNILASYSADDRKLLAKSVSDSAAQAFAEENFPGMDFGGVYPDAIKEYAAVNGLYQTRLKQERVEQGKLIAQEGLKAIDNLDPVSAQTIQNSIGIWAGDPDKSVTVEGVTVPATAFTDSENGASSIFFTDWNGSSSFKNRPAEFSSYDALWMQAVKANGGDLDVSRDQFVELAMDAAADSGYTPDQFAKLSTPQIESLWKTMSDKVGAASTDTGSYKALAQAGVTGGAAGIMNELAKTPAPTAEQQANITKAISALEQQSGPLLRYTSEPNTTTEWAKTPGTTYLKLPAAGGGFTLVSTTVGNLEWKDGEWVRTVSVDDPSGTITNTETQISMSPLEAVALAKQGYPFPPMTVKGKPL